MTAKTPPLKRYQIETWLEEHRSHFEPGTVLGLVFEHADHCIKNDRVAGAGLIIREYEEIIGRPS
jgi:hypothetical protein